MHAFLLGSRIRRLFFLFIFFVFILNLNTKTSFAAVTQQTGFYDTRYISLVNLDCMNCHGTNVSDRHHATYLGVTSQCAYCHPTVEGQPVINRDCKDCHYNSDHHQSSYAANKDCAVCHTPQTVSSAVYDPGVYNPPTDVLPTQCRNCHCGDQSASPPINETRDLHHDVGMDCQTCHYEDLSLNIRLCEQCHQPSTLHALHSDSCTSCHGSAVPAYLPPVISLPSMESLSVLSGLVGEQLTITGTDFGSTQGTVKVGVASASVMSWQDQSIVLTIPNLVPGNHDVVVVNSNGTSNIKVFTVLKPLDLAVEADYGMPDKLYSSYTETDCRNCHQVTVDLHHSTPSGVTCTNCHQIVEEVLVTERNCLICHPTSPHHVSQTAQAGTCTACHSSEIISDLNSVLEPEIFMDEQTPTPGKCSTCHLKRTKGLHHNLGFKCIICHDTDRPTAPVSIRGCENCHSVNTLHKVFTHFQVDQCVGCHSVRPDAFPLLPAGIPEIKELSVNSGGPGAVVTITGTNFGDAFDKGKVYFDEYTAVVLDWCDTSISVQVPSIAKGNYLLTVKNPAGRSNGLIFSVTSPGVITGQVCDTLGRALAGAKVIAGTRVVYTNTSGYYQINTLPQGIYTVQASLKDYLPATQAVTLLESIEIKADFILESKVPPDAIPPSAIIDLKATTVLPNQVTLAWSAATDNVGVSGYNVFRNGQLLTQTSTVPFSDNAVFPATNYQYAVQAYDAAGNKAAVSNTVLVSTPSLPVVGDTTAPTAPVLTVRRDTKSLSAQLSWQAATDNVGIARYEVYRSTSSNWGFTKINSVSAQTLSYKDSAVSEGVTYYYYLLAYDLAGNQAKSNISSVSISRRLSLIPKKNDKKFFDSEIIIKRKDQGNAKNYNSSHIGDAEYCFPDGSLCC